MIALGFSDAGAHAPAPCVTVTESGCTLLLLPDALARTGRDRLAAQLTCQRGLDSFVPFAARAAPSLTVARDWLARNPDLAQAAVADLRGQGQVTLLARTDAPQPASATGGADWLRARARISGTLSARRDALQVHLSRMVEELGRFPFKVSPAQLGLRFDLLVPRDQAVEIRQAWARSLAPPSPQTAGWQATLTGTWPATAFWTEGDMP